MIDLMDPRWPDRLPSQGVWAVTFVVTDRRELGRLLLAAQAVGPVRRVTIVERGGAHASARSPLLPRHAIPHLARVRPWSRRDGERGVVVYLDKRLPAQRVLAGFMLEKDAMLRGLGSDGLQVAVSGGNTLPWVAGDPRAALVRRRALGALPDRLGPSIDVVLLDPTWEDAEARERLRTEAASMGAQTLSVDPQPLPPPDETSRDKSLDLAVGGLPPVDIRVCNPIGFTGKSQDLVVGLPTASTEVSTAGLPDVGDEIRVDLRPRRAYQPLSVEELAELRSARTVVDRDEWHVDDLARARLLAELAAAGVPVTVSDSGSKLSQWLGSELSELLGLRRPSELCDELVRERHSIELRRAALGAHCPEARWRAIRSLLGLPPRPRRTISILLATSRPAQLEHALSQITGQDHESIELVLGLHGHAFPSDIEQRVQDRVRGRVPVQTLRMPSETRFGDVLNAAADASSGELVTKMDDDDWYGREHLADLEMAWAYSGAALVGKAAEFVYLSSLGITIRRFAGGTESWNDRVAGGALLLSRADLAAAGGWRRAYRAVDRRLIDDVRAAGGDVYRTHGFGFILTRHDDGHTWDMGVEYFLRQGYAQLRGLALREAGVCPQQQDLVSMRDGSEPLSAP